MSLLKNLASTWPPQPGVGRGGYVTDDLSRAEPLDLLPLPTGDGHDVALCIARDHQGGLLARVLIRSGKEWREAEAGDGASTALVRLIAGGDCRFGQFEIRAHSGTAQLSLTPDGERSVTVDQTNWSVIAAGRHVVKWLRAPIVSAVGLQRLHHLTTVGFDAMASHLGELVWHDDSGTAPVAYIDEYLEDAVDGWTWCIDALSRHLAHSSACPGGPCPGWFASHLGQLTARMHSAMARPSASRPQPIGWASRDDTRRWFQRAVSRIDEATSRFSSELTDARHLREQLMSALTPFSDLDVAPVVLVHGDLHVGQILRTPAGRYAFIDFDGEPLHGESGEALDSVWPDVAHLVTSIGLVGQVVARRLPRRAAEIHGWSRRSRASFLASYRAQLIATGHGELLRGNLLAAFEAEQLASELLYASDVLPRWAYAPLSLAQITYLH